MSEPLFTFVDAIFFVLGGGALGVVVGHRISEWLRAAEKREVDLEWARLLYRAAHTDDGGESFHEDCGDR